MLFQHIQTPSGAIDWQKVTFFNDLSLITKWQAKNAFSPTHTDIHTSSAVYKLYLKKRNTFAKNKRIHLNCWSSEKLLGLDNTHEQIYYVYCIKCEMPLGNWMRVCFAHIEWTNYEQLCFHLCFNFVVGSWKWRVFCEFYVSIRGITTIMATTMW